MIIGGYAAGCPPEEIVRLILDEIEHAIMPLGLTFSDPGLLRFVEARKLDLAREIFATEIAYRLFNDGVKPGRILAEVRTILAGKGPAGTARPARLLGVARSDPTEKVPDDRGCDKYRRIRGSTAMDDGELADLARDTVDIYLRAMERRLPGVHFPQSPIIYWKRESKWCAKLPERVFGNDAQREWRDRELEAYEKHGVEMVAIWFNIPGALGGLPGFVIHSDGTHKVMNGTKDASRPQISGDRDAMIVSYLNELKLFWPRGGGIVETRGG